MVRIRLIVKIAIKAIFSITLIFECETMELFSVAFVKGFHDAMY